MVCPECGSKISESIDKYSYCCESHLYYSEYMGAWSIIPSLDEKTNRLTDWNGIGDNFLIQLRTSATPNFLLTRLEYLWEITGVKSIRLTETKNSRSEEKLSKYGLMYYVLPFDKSKKRIDYKGMQVFISNLNFDNLELPSLEFSNIPIFDRRKYNSPEKNTASRVMGILQKILSKKGQNLRSKQISAIKSVLLEPVSIVILPTGYGKTRVAHASIIPNLIPDIQSSKGPTLIVYPTISLIDDQRNSWQKDFINEIKEYNRFNPKDPIKEPKVLFLTSAYKKTHEINYTSIFTKLLNGDLDVLCCSPEALFYTHNGISLMDIIQQMKMPFNNFIVDEVHSLFEWGDSIRKDYFRLPMAEKLLRWKNPNLHTILMTATLTPKNENRLISLFDFEEIITPDQRIRHDEIRPDLAFSIIELEKPTLQAPKLIQSQANKIPWNSSKYSFFGIPPFLIYTNMIKKCETIESLIHGPSGDIYHGRISSEKKQKILTKFKSNELEFLVCTSAFGMGVDKKDIWLTSHIGMPYTVQEMYQMFGRTARESGWLTGGPFKNGNCIAFFPSSPEFKPYSPETGVNKLFERLYWCLVDGFSIPGFFLFSIPSREHSFWKPNAELESSKSIYSISDSEEDFSEFDFLNNDQLEVLKKHNLKRSPVRITKDRNKVISRQMRIDKEKEIAENALRLLEQSGYIKILGTHPLIPVSGSGNNNLIDLLKVNGYESVLDSLSKVGINNIGLNTDKERYVVAEVKKPIVSIRDFLNALEEGIKINTDYYNFDQQLLKNFINSEECIRKRFANTLGASNSQSCLETYEVNLNSKSSEILPPIVPCSVCRKLGNNHMSLESKDWFSFDKDNPSIWLSKEQIRYLAGQRNKTIKHKEGIFGKITELPIDNFIIEYALNNKEAKISTKFVQSIVEDLGLAIFKKSKQHRNHYILPYSTYRNGKIVEENIKFECIGNFYNCEYMIPSLDSSHFSKSGYFYGILCYKKNDKLFFRFFNSKESKEIWWSLYTKNGKKLINSYPESKHHFLASPPPSSDGEGSKFWRT